MDLRNLSVFSSRAKRAINNCLWISILSLLSVSASARLELWMIRPVEEFVTNNRELVIEGIVEWEEAKLVAVSVTAPAGAAMVLLTYSRRGAAPTKKFANPSP